MAQNDMDGGSDNGTDVIADNIASETQSDKQPSFDAAKLQTSIDALIGKVGELEARTNGLQSVKDKTSATVSDLKARIAEYEQLKERLGPDGALNQMEQRQNFASEQNELRQTLAEIKQQLSGSVSTQLVGNEASGTMNAAKAIEELSSRDLNANDPEFIKLVNAGLTQDKLNAYIVNKTRPQSPASIAGAVPEPARGGAQKTNPGEMKAEYIQEVQNARGNRNAIKAIQERYKELGFDPGSVGFSV